MTNADVAIVGAGFAGSILARALCQRGLRVLLFDRQHHPRFALGESTTPLANFALERLAARYQLSDLHQLATHGRWLRHHPTLRRGLKRGFTFYAHQQGQIFHNGPSNEARLMVAASPDDHLADTHWLRSDIDHHLLQRAQEEGAEVFQGVEVERLEARPHHFGLHVAMGGEQRRITSRWLVDGSGPQGVLARAMELVPRPPEEVLGGLSTTLVYGHFEGLGCFVDLARAGGAELAPGPYPDERAAVHHLLAEGWIYVLPFDHGVASVGLVLRRDLAPDLAELAARDPTAAWNELLGRYPTLAAQFASARPQRPLATIERLPYRLAPTWLAGTYALPHSSAFFDPIFSTGIAWSLLVVERLANLITGEHGNPSRHHQLMHQEADQVEHLVEAALRSMGDFELFGAVARVYFAAVSFAEAAQRLTGADPALSTAAWEGFLGANEGRARSLFRHTAHTLRDMIPAGSVSHGVAPFGEPTRSGLLSRLGKYLTTFDVAGLTDPDHHNLIPVDLDLLLQRAHLLGLSRAEVAMALPRLRGNDPEGAGPA